MVTTPPSAGRLRSLDGLRGVAAAVVVLHHALFLSPGISNTYYHPDWATPPAFSSTWWLSYTPLKLFTAGEEAVLVFFILSGLVVALPVLRSAKFNWWSYYPQRFLRLQVPVTASVILAVGWTLIHWQNPANASSEWLRLTAQPDFEWQRFIWSSDLLMGEYRINNPLWSLRWELFFSLLLPIFVLIGVVTRRRWVLAIVGSFAVILLGGLAGSPTLQFMPAFLIGTLMAANLDKVRDLAARVSAGRWGNLRWIGIAVLALTSLMAYWYTKPLLAWPFDGRILSPVTVTLGSTLIIFLIAGWRPASRLFETRPIQWLGRISFSLYLVHVPIVVAAGYIAGPQHWYLAAVIAPPVALVVAELFFRFVEAPAHNLSKRAGKAAAERMAKDRAQLQERADAQEAAALDRAARETARLEAVERQGEPASASR